MEVVIYGLFLDVEVKTQNNYGANNRKVHSDDFQESHHVSCSPVSSQVSKWLLLV
jgi:hypothetical protein